MVSLSPGWYVHEHADVWGVVLTFLLGSGQLVSPGQLSPVLSIAWVARKPRMETTLVLLVKS